MAWIKIRPPAGDVRDIYGKVSSNIRTLIDYTEDDTSVDRYAALLQVTDYSVGGTDTITIDPSDASSTTWTEGTDFNAATDNATTASNIASAINSTADYSAEAVTGSSYDPWVSIEYTGGGHIDSASSGDTNAWAFQTVNATNGTIAKIASDDTGTRKNQPLFTDSDGLWTCYVDNRGDIDVKFDSSSLSDYTDVTLPGVSGLSYDESNTEVDLDQDLNANNNDLLNVDNINFSTATELTISSGAITVDQTLHTVDTESDASSDDLTTINRSGSENFVIIRPKNDGRTIVVKHDATGGNIKTFSQNDITLDSTDKAVLLVYDSSNSVWQAIGGGGGSITGFEYDKTNDELDATKTINLNDNPLTNVSSIDYGGKFGVRWVQSNQTDSELERLGGAERLSPGANYDSLAPWGEMVRCNVADDGTVNAYRGDSSYVEDGSNGQVMVEIPKFYYKVNHGASPDYWEWWISPTNQTGYSLHPAFSRGGVERDYIYVGAYEATVYDDSASSYVGDGITYEDSNDIMASVANLQPISGNSDNLNILEARQLASNRGTGWAQIDFLSRSAVYMLYLVEYADFNTQNTISEGITNLDSGSGNHSQNTGHTSELGNETGEVVISSLENGASGASETYACSYRGIENLWGNIWTFNDGVFVKDDGFYFEDDPSSWNSDGTGYTYVSASPINSDGYIDDYLYNSSIDWLFYASSVTGSSSTEVCDKQWSHDSGEVNILLSGGLWLNDSDAGLGFLRSRHDVTISTRAFGSRLMYVGS